MEIRSYDEINFLNPQELYARVRKASKDINSKILLKVAKTEIRLNAHSKAVHESSIVKH